MFNNEIRLQRYKIKTENQYIIQIFVKKSRNSHINNRFYIVKTENERRYLGVFAAGNRFIHSKNFSVVDCSIGDWRMVFFLKII